MLPLLSHREVYCDGTCAETRFPLSSKRMSPFKSAGTSVQSTTASRGVRISGSNAGYTMFRGSVEGTGYPLHSPVSPTLPLQCVTVCHHILIGLYIPRWPKEAADRPARKLWYIYMQSSVESVAHLRHCQRRFDLGASRAWVRASESCDDKGGSIVLCLCCPVWWETFDMPLHRPKYLKQSQTNYSSELILNF